MQGELPRHLISPMTSGTIPVKKNATSKPALDQMYNTGVNAVSGISDLDPYQPMSNNCPSSMQPVFLVTGESLEINSHNGATHSSEEPVVSSETNESSAFRSHWD